MNRVLKTIYSQCANHHIYLAAQYVALWDNISNMLSRGNVVGFLAGFPSTHSHSDMKTPGLLRGQLQSWSIRPRLS